MNIFIKRAAGADAALLHQIMTESFEEFRELNVNIRALRESVEEIRDVLEKGTEQAVICFMEGRAQGAVRFQVRQNHLYFCRLSVRPEARRKGVAKALLSWLENYGREHDILEIWCHVRKTVSRNMNLYQGLEFCIEEETTGDDPSLIVMKKRLAVKV